MMLMRSFGVLMTSSGNQNSSCWIHLPLPMPNCELNNEVNSKFSIVYRVVPNEAAKEFGSHYPKFNWTFKLQYMGDYPLTKNGSGLNRPTNPGMLSTIWNFSASEVCLEEYCSDTDLMSPQCSMDETLCPPISLGDSITWALFSSPSDS